MVNRKVSKGSDGCLRIERGDAPAVLYGDVPAALNGDASIACFMGRACAPLERTPLRKLLHSLTYLNNVIPSE